MREKSEAAAALTKSVDDKQRLLLAAFKKIKSKEDALARALGATEAAAAEAEKRQNAEAARRARRPLRRRRGGVGRGESLGGCQVRVRGEAGAAMQSRLDRVSASLESERAALSPRASR